MSQQPNLQQILERFNAQNVRYVIIGGVAMWMNGASHFTEDIDICYARDAPNLRALADALAPLHPSLRGAPPGLPFLWDVRTLKAGLNFTLSTDLGAIDLLGDAPGVSSFDGLLERAIVIYAHNLPVRVACIDDLIAMKRAANRPKDQSHVRELENLKRFKQENE